ncbi:FAD-dependent oxidoreductase [Sulfitobacter sp. S190]|uniref:FAD-dependent oxidoreductase n=1 Tax=Sulfitobacter sp. S190 TaxID=2867022 RepID=UPI0021A4F801|nr:FAD-dependent oxidoreductase [Sulfitobacter sp. S190]UWR21929.1 FAD-dependent oxidoreductase [Sulfitobacter sp. S190]
MTRNKQLLLIGGGHTHALVLAGMRRSPWPGIDVTVVNPGQVAPYSGMLPGFVAGHYTRSALEIDLAALTDFENCTWCDGRAVGLDPGTRQIRLESGAPLSYDLCSFDVGITTRMPDLAGFADHAVPAKPLADFAGAWDRYRAGSDPAHVAVIGGGVAGAELSMAMAYALRGGTRDTRVHLFDRSDMLSELSEPMRNRMMRALARNGVTCHADTAITHVTQNAVHLSQGAPVAADFIVGVAGALPHRWVGDTGLTLSDGFIAVDASLQSSEPGVFAVGDCAEMTHDPRPKAGVYAVRQAPILAHNLQAQLSGGQMRAYHPQADYLKLISLGRKSALGSFWGIPVAGGHVWQLKNWIDQRFMSQFPTP